MNCGKVKIGGFLVKFDFYESVSWKILIVLR